MQTEVILEVQFYDTFKIQIDYLLKNKEKINCLHIINISNDPSINGQLQILKIKNLGWIKTHNKKNNLIDFLSDNFNSINKKYIFISSFVCWQTKKFIEEFFDNINHEEITVPQIFNSDRIFFLHQVFGFLKTFTLRPWDDEYIDTIDLSSSDHRILDYIHNNYLSLIKNENFESIKFHRYYFNSKEAIPNYIFGWIGSLDKKWAINGSIFCSIIAQNKHLYDCLYESNLIKKYKNLMLEQDIEKYVQLELDLLNEPEKKLTLQMEFDFDLFENTKNKSKNVNINIAINSHIMQDKKITDNLIKSLIKNNIKPSNIYVFIGGNSEPKKEIRNGINYYYVDHNSYDHTSVISIIEENLVTDYWLCIHDSCEAGERFFENLTNCPKSKFSAILEDGWLNMGLFSQDFLDTNKEYILKLKNCNKMQAILSEQIYSRLGDASYINSRAKTQLKSKSNVYNDGVERLTIYFADLDLYKYQTYHYNSEYTKNLKDKYLVDIYKLT